MRIEIGDKIKFFGEDETFTVLYFNEKFVISLNSSNICSIIDLKHDGKFDIVECQETLDALGIENKINFNEGDKLKIEKVTKKPNEVIDYPSEAYEYKGYYDLPPLKSNAYYSYLK